MRLGEGFWLQVSMSFVLTFIQVLPSGDCEYIMHAFSVKWRILMMFGLQSGLGRLRSLLHSTEDKKLK